MGNKQILTFAIIFVASGLFFRNYGIEESEDGNPCLGRYRVSWERGAEKQFPMNR